MKDEESKLADELFDVVKKLIDRSLWKINDDGIRLSDFLQGISLWKWNTKKEFLLNTLGQQWMSFAKACVYHNLVSSLDVGLKNAVLIMASSSSLEEIRLKFAAAGLLPEEQIFLIYRRNLWRRFGNKGSG